MTTIQYISQLGGAAARGTTDLFPVTQGSTGPGTGTTLKMTMAQLLASTPLTGTTTLGSDLANYLTVIGAASGSAPVVGAAGVDTHIGVSFLPKGSYPATTTKLLVAPTANWAAGSANFVTRLRPQLQVFQSSSSVTTGTGFYPQFSVSGGTVSGYADSGGAGLANFNVMTVDADNVIANRGTGPQGLALLGLSLGVGNSNGATGGAHAGGRNAIAAEVFINSDVDIGAGSLFHVGVAGGTTTYRKMGGVAGSDRGNVFGSNVWARALGGSGGGPRYLNSMVGTEIGIRQETNVSALWKVGLQIVEENTSAANAVQQNIGLSLTNQPSATTIGWGQGISFGAYNGQFPIASNGQLIASLPTPIGLSSFAAADGMNLARIAFSRAAIETPGFYVDGSGNLGGQTVGGLALQTVSAVNAKVSTVSSITVVDGGAFDGGNPAPFPTFTIASPATSGGIAGTTATMTVATMGAVGFTGITTGGSGYTAGDVLTAVSGTGTAFTITVETVTSGQPVNIRVQSAGSYSVLPTNPVSFTGGTGTGFTCGMRWTILTLNSGGSGGSLAGTNYNELRPPVVTFTGSMTQTKEARFKVVMSAGTLTTLVLNSGGAVTAPTSLAVGDGTARQPFAHSSFFSPVAGLMSTAPFSTSGNAFGAVTSGAAFFRQFNINADTVDASAATGGGVNVNYFGHTISAGAVGGRTTFSTFMSQQGATTSAVGQFYVAGALFGEAAYSAGGSAGAGNARGNLFAANHSARLKTGAGLYWNSLVGEEVDVSVQASTSVVYKVGFKVVQWVDDAVSGTTADYAYGISNQPSGTAPGWDKGFAVGAPEGWWPIKATGTIHGTYAATIGGGPAMAAAYGIDYSAVAFSSGFLKSTGFLVDGSGTTTTTGRISGVRVITAAGAVAVAATDEVIVINKTVGAATVVNLTAGVTGKKYIIKDGKGDAAANNITITPATGNIDGAGTLVLNINYAKATIVYNGTQWNQIG